MSDSDCLFCNFVAGDPRPDVVHETDTTLAFRDINPQAPTHVLVVPKNHHPNAAALAEAAPDVMADLVRSAAAVAEAEGWARATGSCSTPAPRRGRRSSTSTCTCWAVGRWSGRPDEGNGHDEGRGAPVAW